jgi:predicted porin
MIARSNVGLKIEEGIGGGWAAIGRLETGFDPVSGEINDACAAFVRNNGKTVFQQASQGNSARCGQALNAAAWAGVTNGTYGTLTIGRQNTTAQDVIGGYDPLSSSPALSLIGFTGTWAGGGNTTDSVWDNSIKYAYVYGPVHVAGMYTNGGDDTSVHHASWNANVGATYKGFSIDAYYIKTNGADIVANTTTSDLRTLNGTISDNEAWAIMGKYTFEFGGGFKDEGPGAKLTLSAGYENLKFSDPKDPVGVIVNGVSQVTTDGGYVLNTTNKTFGTPRVYDMTWAGARYALPSGWTFSTGYYHLSQDEFLNATGKNCANGTKSTVAGTVATPSNCAGNLDVVSVLADYQFNKYFDVYAGVSHSEVSGGLSNGFLNTDQTTVVSGMRLRF